MSREEHSKRRLNNQLKNFNTTYTRKVLFEKAPLVVKITRKNEGAWYEFDVGNKFEVRECEFKNLYGTGSETYEKEDIVSQLYVVTRGKYEGDLIFKYDCEIVK